MDSAARWCTRRSKRAWQGASGLEHRGVDGIGRVGIRQPSEPGWVADDPGETGQPPEMKSIVPQGEEEENVRLSHVRRTEYNAFGRPTHGDELLGEFV